MLSPSFETAHGNILWDCIANLDASTTEILNKLGGIDAIAVSHPHYYTTMAEWSNAFHNAPVYLHMHDSLKPFKFDAIYGAFGQFIKTNAAKSLEFSIENI